MEDGTFMTGVDLGYSLTQSQPVEQKPKVEEKNQMPPLSKIATAKPKTSNAPKSLQGSKNESFPHLQPSRDLGTKNGMRHSMTESNFKKPLFKKLATVRDYFEKNKGNNENDKIKSENKTMTHWKSKRDDHERQDFTHADALNAKIVQKFDELYKSKKGFEATHTEGFAKRKHFFQEIEKQESKLQGEQKKFDQIAFDLNKKKKLLEQLKTLEEDFIKKLEDTEGLKEEKVAKQEELRDWEEKIEVEEYKNESLKHMKQLKKELLLNVKKKYYERKDLYDLHQEGIDYCNRHTESEKIVISNNRNVVRELKKKKNIKDNLIDPEFEEMLEEEISEFEERRNLREIFKHEKVIEEELRRQEELEERRIQMEKEEAWRKEENARLEDEAKHETELNKIKSQYQEFQKVTHVSKKDQLIEYFDGLEQRNFMLKEEIDSINEGIKQKKEELAEIKKNLKFKKFEEVKPPKDNFSKDLRIDDFELILREKQNELAERENHIKRTEKLSYEVCTVVSRVLKQLQKSKTPVAVDKKNVMELLTICGLKLERMLTVVIKKKKTFFIESINTDGTIQEGPPSYMNIISDDVYHRSKKQYEKDKPIEIGEELEDSYISQLRTNIKHHDNLDMSL